MNQNKNNFDINLNAGTTLAGATVANNKQDEYVNLNCYKIVDGVPLWLFRVSTVPLNRNATEKFLQKQTTPTMDSIWLYYMYENGSLQGSTEPIWVVQLWTLLDDLQQEVRILDFDIVDIAWLTLWLWDKVKVEVIE